MYVGPDQPGPIPIPKPRLEHQPQPLKGSGSAGGAWWCFSKENQPRLLVVRPAPGTTFCADYNSPGHTASLLKTCLFSSEESQYQRDRRTPFCVDLYPGFGQPQNPRVSSQCRTPSRVSPYRVVPAGYPSFDRPGYTFNMPFIPLQQYPRRPLVLATLSGHCLIGEVDLFVPVF